MNGHGLTHDEIIFRVMLAREEARPKLSFEMLEKSLPKNFRKSIEGDWRAFIRDEGLEFDSAFQKAVRKHLPGLYYVIIAAEFIHRLPFHEVLGHFLGTSGINKDQIYATDEVFALAEAMAREVNRRGVEALKRQHAKGVVKSPLSAKSSGHPNEPQLAKSPQQSSQRLAKFGTIPLSKLAPAPPSPLTVNSNEIRCAFCRKNFRREEIGVHIEKVHLTPKTAPSPARDMVAQISKPELLPQNPSVGPSGSISARFKHGRCIGCDNLPIPGDFYCYYCAPK